MESTIRKDENSFRAVILRLALALILNSVLITGLFAVRDPLRVLLLRLLSSPIERYGISTSDAEFIISSVLDCVIYLFSFMFPVLFFRILMSGQQKEPMRLGVRVPAETILLIGAVIPVIMGAAEVNAIISGFVDFSPLIDNTLIDTPAKLIYSFIYTALVPGFCEEFLFRGTVLSNLLPYGKTTAVVGSAVLFALMHGNPMQFFYAAAAGILLGIVYVRTGSVWPGMFIHIINNYIGVLRQYFAERVDYTQAARLIYAIDFAIMIAGAVFIVILILKDKGNIFGNDGGYAEPTHCVRLERGRAVRLFFNPVMIVYISLQLTEAAIVLLAAVISG
ncbi:MAG: CPBP family intramembrane metalloprotease [Clostridia bacterium]|nr:CPBP family intramembrane metalloprotease [Clostridia bacterium]